MVKSRTIVHMTETQSENSHFHSRVSETRICVCNMIYDRQLDQKLFVITRSHVSHITSNQHTQIHGVVNWQLQLNWWLM